MGLFGPKQRRKVNITSREVSERVVPESGQTGAYFSRQFGSEFCQSRAGIFSTYT